MIAAGDRLKLCQRIEPTEFHSGHDTGRSIGSALINVKEHKLKIWEVLQPSNSCRNTMTAVCASDAF